jgi:hypothetical protein
VGATPESTPASADAIALDAVDAREIGLDVVARAGGDENRCAAFVS